MRCEHNCSVLNMLTAGLGGCDSLAHPGHGRGPVPDGCAGGSHQLHPPGRCVLALPGRLLDAAGSAHAHLRDSAAFDCEGNIVNIHETHAKLQV